MKHILVLSLFLFAAFAVFGQRSTPNTQQTPTPTAQAYDFQTINFPGAASTQAYGLNNCGDVVGFYVDVHGTQHGFAYSKKDGYRTIDIPGAAEVYLFGINDAQTIVGGWRDNSGILRGFVLINNKTTPVNFPGAVDTLPLGINAQGDIVGGYDLGDQSTTIGFLFRKGRYSALQNPIAAPSQTQPNGINNRGQIVGDYGDASGVFHAFLLEEGRYSTIDFPEAQQDSVANGINSAGQVAARYFDGPGNNQGYVFFRGDYAPLIFPGAAATSAQGINDKGQIVGFYRAVGGGPVQSFIASPEENGGH
jgi:uncharacterized membrane protein